MKSFTLTTDKKLSDLKEDVITIKQITSDSIENLLHISIMVHKKYPNGSTQSYPLPTFDRELLYTRTAQININHKIVDCGYATLELNNPKGKTFEISYETLADKLQQNKEKEDQTRSNVKSEVVKWQNSVNSLFQNIIEWITPYQDNIKHEIVKYSINEEISGSYDISILTIKPNIGKPITFRPVGTFVIGAEGRIDININNFGKPIMLILHREKVADKWLLIVNRNLQNQIVFDKAQLINLLDEVISA